MDDNMQNNSQSAAPASDELDKLKTERDEYLNGWKRTKADFVNYQKDEAGRLEEMAKFGSWDILRDIAAVIDNYNLALASMEKAGTPPDKGLHMIKGQLEDLLKRRGVIRIDVRVGEAFNPMYHEAIAMVEGDDNVHSGEIKELVEDGYLMHERVLKAARVKVVK